MKPEYVIMIGNMFLKDWWGNDSTINLTPKQNEAKRYIKDADMKDIVAKLDLYEVPFVVMRIDISAEVHVVTKVVERVDLNS